jgi:diacylglycerol kinase
LRRERKWLHSFRYAYEGIQYALSTQRNMKFHFFAAFITLTAALLLGLSKTDVLFILLAVTLVIVTELINTGIEKAVDLAMPDIHPLAKIAKDVAAASVLVSGFFAVAVGMVVFYDPIDQLLRKARLQSSGLTPSAIWLLIGLVMLTVIVVEMRISRPQRWPKPSLLAACALAVATIIAFLADSSLVVLLAYLLAGLVLFILYEKKRRSLLSLLFGGWIGSMVTLLIYLIQHK